MSGLLLDCPNPVLSPLLSLQLFQPGATVVLMQGIIFPYQVERASVNVTLLLASYVGKTGSGKSASLCKPNGII